MGGGAVVGIVLGALLVTSCAAAHPGRTAAGRLRVVAAESPWGKVAAAIGGDDAQVVSLVAAANVDPHEYQPTAPAAAAVAQAAVVIDNGLGYDTFMDRLLATGATGPRRVVTAADVLDVHGAGANPHLWYALERVPTVALAIERAMAAADPSHARAYATRLAAFDRSLDPLLADVAAIARQHGGTKVAQTERVAGYLLHEAHLDVVGPTAFALAVEAGQSPDAAATEAMDHELATRQVAALVLNLQTAMPVTDHAAALARGHRVPVVGVTETVQPPQRSFVAWQTDQVDELRAALRGAA
jgi:zinc/manganese transport system substrate-binding protein